MARRLEPSVQYRRLIKRTLVSSLRTVFSDQYPDPQLQNLYISVDHPLKREQFPSVIVSYEESVVKNAGVGHIEELQDDRFLTIQAKHFMFEGRIKFQCYALSPLDLDILSDSVVELLAFGRLDNLMNKFFDSVFSGVPDTAQISLHSDYLTPLGDSSMSTFWGSEDGLVYQGGYSISCSGGFYNVIKEGDVANYIEDIIVYGSQPYTNEEEKLLELVGNFTLDPFYVHGRASASALSESS